MAAVVEAGALGFLTALTERTPEDLPKEIECCQDMTDKPFGVNLTILPTINPPPYDEYRRVIVNTARVASNSVSREVVRILDSGGAFPDVQELVAGMRGRP